MQRGKYTRTPKIKKKNSKATSRLGWKMSKHPYWKGGKTKTGLGYILVRKLNHPFVKGNGYVLEHRLVMEKYLRRYLQPNEAVHHLNGNITDNRIENLYLTNHFIHPCLHPHPKAFCSHPGCDKKHCARGLCRKHYRRFMKVTFDKVL